MLKALIVEDSDVFRRSLSDLLRSRFPAMLVAQAGDIAEALKKIAEIGPGLVFVDIKLREENGLDLVRNLRKTRPDIVIVVITSYDLPEYRQAAYDHGADYFISKGNTASSDILMLVDSIATGQPPQWTLGADFINPSLPRPPGKK